MKFSAMPRWAVLLTAGLLLPAAAQAHLVSTGLGPFYDGLSHFVLTPEDLLPALALALLVGLNGARVGRTTLFVLPAAWLAGGLAGLAWPTTASMPALTVASFLVLGAMVAADLRLRLAWAVGLALLLGGVNGYFNGSAMAGAKLGLTGLAGIVSALFVAVALAAALAVAQRAPWARIALRVAGSWVAAAGLLLLGWSLRAA
jgi:hydrogenase/urease accessory protein HupE